MRIKIESDGTPQGTRVLNAETGDMVEGVTGVEWVLPDCNSYARATLIFERVECEVIGEAEEPTNLTRQADPELSGMGAGLGAARPIPDTQG